jgi:hypothetical protein
VVLSKGHKVVGPSYSRVTGVAANVTDKRENLVNHCRVNRVSKMEQHDPSWVSQNSNADYQADRVGRATWVIPNSSADRLTDQVSWVSQVGNTEHKKGGSIRVANTGVQVIEN